MFFSLSFGDYEGQRPSHNEEDFFSSLTLGSFSQRTDGAFPTISICFLAF
ncbi:MAG: hypothetical protein PWP57_1270 [Candidatus Atribacteria bacterium]|nr:hypothetical protein [Candidatus Atribacteria bacterium]